MKSWVTIVLTAAVAGAGVSACSSSSNPKAAFQNSANSICSKSAQTIESLPKPSSGDVPGAATYFTKFSSLLTDMQTQLKALNPPSQDSTAFNSALSSLANLITDSNKASSAFTASDASGAQAASTALQTDADSMSTQFDSIGLNNCGGAGSNSSAGGSSSGGSATTTGGGSGDSSSTTTGGDTSSTTDSGGSSSTTTGQ